MREALRCGTTDILHMEVDVVPEDIEAETGNAACLAPGPGGILRGAFSSCRPEAEGFAASLERQLMKPFVKGFRRGLDEVSESAIFGSNLRRLSGARRPIELCVLADQIDKAIALADLASEFQFVLDHRGVPAIKGRAEHPWREKISEIALRPNVVVKISGVVADADKATWTVDDIRPYVEHAIDRFGWDRVAWSSGWLECTLTGSLSTWLSATQALTFGCSDDERRRLFSANGRRIWRPPDFMRPA